MADTTAEPTEHNPVDDHLDGVPDRMHEMLRMHAARHQHWCRNAGQLTRRIYDLTIALQIDRDIAELQGRGKSVEQIAARLDLYTEFVVERLEVA